MSDVPELIRAVTNMVNRMGALIDNLSVIAAEQARMSKTQNQIIVQLNKHSEMLVNHEHRISCHDKCRHFEPHDPHGETSALRPVVKK